nr:immunoglobulin light chain junction region [Macaca mulatta]MOX11979.1 immunoglobulin light chain junction region [Macaca mulatta]MOX12111.1 immunoglobulin light chain junction region [Macaca mulatta]MOX13164.1 immunoglobulin light chain junction region [Macaca mulatta]
DNFCQSADTSGNPRVF